MKSVTIAFLMSTWAVSAQTLAGENSPPTKLSTSDWSSIRAAYETNRLAAFPVGPEFHARNLAQQWKLRFDGRGFDATPDAGGWSWGLKLVSFGREGAEQPVDSPRCIDMQGSRVSYEWDDSLTEWYINDHRGLEHGFIVHRPPVSARVRAGRTELLQLTLSVRGDLRPKVSGDVRSIMFGDLKGATVVNYRGLTVFDADGIALPAWFESKARDGRRVSIQLSVDDTNARYPLTIDPIAQQAYLKASNTGLQDLFGTSVAVSGNTVVVGAPYESSNATGVNGNQANGASRSGAAYVFVHNGTNWVQEAYLKASNTNVNDYFGYSVSVSGDTVLVGAYGEASNATGVDGNQADNSTFTAGAAYVFVRNGTTWSQQAYLKASNTRFGAAFGSSVSVSGDTVVVGAYGDMSASTGVNGNQADTSFSWAGAAYVFVRSGTTWSQQAYLKASNTGPGDRFGQSVAVFGDTVVVGADGEDSNATGGNGDEADNSAQQSGAAYVFARNGTIWSQQAYLKASNTDSGDFFGRSVGVYSNTLVVGAFGEDSNTVGVNGDQTNNSASFAGAAYVFVRNGTIWTQQAYLKASNTDSDENFGTSVAVAGEAVVVGASGEDSSATGVNSNQADNSATYSGAAYVFFRSDAIWTQHAYLKASNTGANDNFGQSVCATGNTIVVAATGEQSNAIGVNGDQANDSLFQSGAAYVFTVLACPSVIGDMNCDCAAGVADIYAFSRALLTGTANPPCDLLNGDMNADGLVNGADIQGFVDLLVP